MHQLVFKIQKFQYKIDFARKNINMFIYIFKSIHHVMIVNFNLGMNYICICIILKNDDYMSETFIPTNKPYPSCLCSFSTLPTLWVKTGVGNIYFTFKMWVKSIDNIHFILFKVGCKESRLFDHERVSNHKLKRKKVQKEFVQVKDNDLHCMQYITHIHT